MKNLMIKSSISAAALLTLVAVLPASANAQIGFYNTDSYIGAGTGAVLGGVIGSNLAGSGVQQEGTAIGAVLGGLAGNALSNSGRAYNSGYNSGYSNYNSGYGTQSSRYGAQSGRYGYSSTSYGAPQPLYTGPRPGPYYTGGYVAGPVMTGVIPQAPVRVMTPAPRRVYHAPRTVTHTVIVRPEPTVTHYQAPQARTIIEQVPCPSGTSTQADGTCLENTVVAAAPTYTAPTYSAPTYSAPAYTAPAPVYSAPEMAPCPAGTTSQTDGSCMETGSAYSSNLSYNTPAYSAPSYSTPSYSSPAPSYSAPEMASCPAGTTSQADGTCMETGSAYSSSFSSNSSYAHTPSYSSATMTYTAPTTTPMVHNYDSDTIVYGGGSYDSLAGSVHNYESSADCNCNHAGH